MRINIHERTPKDFKKMKLFLVLSGIVMCIMPVFLAFLFIVEAKAYLLAIITLVLPAVVIYLGLRSVFYMAQSYAEFDEEKVVIVECYAFRRKIKTIQRNVIKQRESISVTQSPGRTPAMTRQTRTFMDALNYIGIYKNGYIVFKDENGQYLFKILDCPEGNQWADELMK